MWMRSLRNFAVVTLRYSMTNMWKFNYGERIFKNDSRMYIRTAQDSA